MVEMKREEVLIKVIDIVAKLTAVDATIIIEDSKYIDDLLVDSVRMVQIIASLESEFKHEIDERDAAKFRTVGNTVDYLMNNVIVNYNS